MDPVTYRNAAGQERVVSSQEGAVTAEFDGFYAPDSPSGKRLAGRKAAETRKARATTTARKTTTRKASTRKRTSTAAPEGPTPEQAAAPDVPTGEVFADTPTP